MGYIAAGADLSPVDEQGLTPIDVALGAGHTSIVLELLQAGSQPSICDPATFLTAVRSGELDLVNAMIAAKVDINWRDSAGQSALTTAIAQQHWPVIQALLRNGARTPSSADLFVAVANDDRLLVAWMMDSGVDPNIRDEEGTTPLQADRYCQIMGGGGF
jgi:ankyrin repeat protein